MDDQRNATTAARVMRAFEAWDLDAYESLLPAATVEGRPQLGIQFTGRAAIMSMYRAFPGRPRFHWHRLRGSGDLWVVEGTIDFGDEPQLLVGILHFQDGELQRSDYYFATPLPPPTYHAPWSQPLSW
jgi:hypothetical protein